MVRGNMRTPQEIAEKLIELKSDERMSYPSTSVFVNAPLALHQMGAATKINTLEWVLGYPISTFPLKAKAPKG
jgi:hypothetical protein